MTGLSRRERRKWLASVCSSRYLSTAHPAMTTDPASLLPVALRAADAASGDDAEPAPCIGAFALAYTHPHGLKQPGRRQRSGSAL